MMLAVALALYTVAIVLAFLYREHQTHGHGIQCIGCVNRRRAVRVAVVILVGALILWEGEIHAPDLGFIALAILVELT